MGLGLRRGYALHNEPDPVPTFCTDHKQLPIKIEQRVERCVTRHLLSLSHTDKCEKNPKVEMADSGQIALENVSIYFL
jgi:hypothetical protein